MLPLFPPLLYAGKVAGVAVIKHGGPIITKIVVTAAVDHILRKYLGGHNPLSSKGAGRKDHVAGWDAAYDHLGHYIKGTIRRKH